MKLFKFLIPLFLSTSLFSYYCPPKSTMCTHIPCWDSYYDELAAARKQVYAIPADTTWVRVLRCSGIDGTGAISFDTLLVNYIDDKGMGYVRFLTPRVSMDGYLDVDTISGLSYIFHPHNGALHIMDIDGFGPPYKGKLIVGKIELDSLFPDGLGKLVVMAKTEFDSSIWFNDTIWIDSCAKIWAKKTTETCSLFVDATFIDLISKVRIQNGLDMYGSAITNLYGITFTGADSYIDNLNKLTVDTIGVDSISGRVADYNTYLNLPVPDSAGVSGLSYYFLTVSGDTAQRVKIGSYWATIYHKGASIDTSFEARDTSSLP